MCPYEGHRLRVEVAVTAPAFRPLTKEEYEKLSLDERVRYMAQLIEHVRHLVAETNQQMEQYKKAHPPSE